MKYKYSPKIEIINIYNIDKLKREVLYMTRIFGTDGVSGIANTELTADLAYKLGRAGAFVLTEGTHKPKIIVGNGYKSFRRYA